MIAPLVTITGTGAQVLGARDHYDVECRDCGPLPALSDGDSLFQAGLVRDRHLAEHLEALAQEFKDAAR